MAGHLHARSALFASLGLACALGAPSQVGAPGAGIALAAHASPTRNGKLAFVYRGMHNEFYRITVFNPDGSGPRDLTPACALGPCVMSSLTWSPDGTHLAFLGFMPASGAHPSVLVIDSNGRGEKRLARLVIGEKTRGFPWWWGSRLSWSPDGARIIFAQSGWLSIVNTHTGTLRRVTNCTVPLPPQNRPATGCSDSNPSWSPDGSHIIFVRTLNASSSGEYIMNANGSGVKPLGPLPADANDFAWSPNGHRIVFDTDDRIYVVNPDGSGLTLLLSAGRGSGELFPSWSPDGTRILYFKTPSHYSTFKPEVWVMNAAGSQRRRLYDSACCVWTWGPPSWSPNGKQILFSAGLPHGPHSDTGTFLMDADGRHRHRLPDFAPSSWDLAWQPLP